MTRARLAGLYLAAVLMAAPCADSARAAAVDDLLKHYTELGASNFSASAGEAFWERQFADAKGGEPRKCSLCHTTDLKRTGKHATTGKVIEPLAPSVNPKRLTDAKEIEKWLARNCKWTVGRECTPQEKGDVLTMIRGR
jgi:hypothetical protein